jgi:hypothetical protein
MPGTRLVADEDFAWAERVFTQRVGGWVIHFPRVVGTRSPTGLQAYAFTSSLLHSWAEYR